MCPEISTLANGLRVVTHPMEHLESAAIGVWVGVGARHEITRQHGISHLLEHMAFKGTHRRSALDISEAIENVGGEINAATGSEVTSFYTRILKEHVPLSVDLLSDILAHSRFAKEELEREKNVIVQEIGSVLDTPDEWVYDLLLETAFPHQPLGRTILGTPETVRDLTEVDLREFLARHYQAPAMVLSAAGRVHHKDIVALAEAGFCGFPAKSQQPPMNLGHFSPGTHLEARPLAETHITLGFQAPSLHESDYYTAQVLAIILGGGSSSRLFQKAREERGLCYFISAFHWAFADTGLFGIATACNGEEADALLAVIRETLKGATENITETEVARARAQARASLLMALESPFACAGHNARNLLVYGRIPHHDEILGHIEAVNAEALAAFAAKTFINRNIALAAIGDSRRIPDCETLRAQLAAG